MFRSSRAKLRNMSYALRWGTRHRRSKVSEDRSSFPPSSSQLSSNEKLQVLIWIETLLWGCHLRVKGLLHQKLLSSAMVEHCGLLRVHPSGGTHGYSWLLNHLSLAGTSVFLQSRFQSPFCLPDVDLHGCSCRGYDIPHWIAYRAVAKLMYPWPWSTLSGESARA